MRMAFAFLVLASMSTAAVADTGPVVVIPSRAGVPIMIEGVDASFAVIEGEWGLGKDVRIQPTVYGGHPPPMMKPAGHYFPRTGRQPGYGRYESNAPQRLLPGDGSYYRSWSAQSPRGYELPQPDPPPIIYAPQSSAPWPGPVPPGPFPPRPFPPR